MFYHDNSTHSPIIKVLCFLFRSLVYNSFALKLSLRVTRRADLEASSWPPKLKRRLPNTTDIPSPKLHQYMSRVPLNQVERKYCQRLNLELARLSSVVPALSRSDEGA
jgi:hypothetical protein